jgi:Fe-S-cluster containining protein
MSGDETADEVPECLACGACCFADLPHYVRVMGEDYARLGEDAEELTVWRENQAFMKMTDGRCAALDLRPADRVFACTIYERRPAICRELHRGSPACRAERHGKAQYALRVLG